MKAQFRTEVGQNKLTMTKTNQIKLLRATQQVQSFEKNRKLKVLAQKSLPTHKDITHKLNLYSTCFFTDSLLAFGLFISFSVLTCELAFVMFSRVKQLARRLSSLNLCRQRLAVSLTMGSFRFSAVGQSGHVSTTAVAGTEHKDQEVQRSKQNSEV